MPYKTPTKETLALAQNPMIGYGGTGMSLGELDELPQVEREALLMATLALYNEKIDGLVFLRNQTRELLLSDMRREDRRATVAVAGEWKVRLTPRRKYTYDIEALKQLQLYLTDAEYSRVISVHDSYEVNRVELKALRDRGGQIAEIIATGEMEETIGWEVEVSRVMPKKKTAPRPEVAIVVRTGEDE